MVLLQAAAARAGERQIVATMYPMEVAVLNIVQGTREVKVSLLASRGDGCLHDYHLTPRDMATLSRADLVVANGAGLEPFLEAVTNQFPSVRVIEASRGIALLPGPDGVNGHVWLSPGRHARQVESIAEGLAAWDPGQGALYRTNAARYAARLRDLHHGMELEIRRFPVRKLVTLHDAFAYLAQDTGLEVVATLEREPGEVPSAGALAALLGRIRDESVRVVFDESDTPDGTLVMLARQAGLRRAVLDPVVTGAVDTESYLKAMERNLFTLRKELGEPIMRAKGIDRR